MIPTVVAAMMMLLGAFAVGLLHDIVDEWYDREVRRIWEEGTTV